MKGKLTTLLLAALVFVFLLQSVADDHARTEKNFSAFENLQQTASSEGNVRVIVKLKVPEIKELTAASNRFGTVLPGKQAEWGGAQADMALKDAITRVTDEVLYSLGGTQYEVNHTYSFIPYVALNVSAEALSLLESLPDVLDIVEDKPSRLPLPVKSGEQKINKDGTPIPPRTDPPRLNNTIGIIGADTAWGMGYTGSGWYVAILDTGIRKTHQFFTGKTVVEQCYALGSDGSPGAGDCPNGLDSMSGTGSAVHHSSSYDGWDHGTHVSGIATGNYSPMPLYGVAKDANIIAVQVFSKFGAAACGGSPCVMSWDSDSGAGLDYVYSIRGSYSIAAVNMSLGGGAYSSACNGDSRKAAIDNLRSAGIATAIATGNNGYCGYVGAPSCISTCVSVGASDDSDDECYFNNWHVTMQRLFAPGDYIYSSTGDTNSSYESWSGTSMATPHVAGAWALLRQANPSASVDEILTSLENTGVDVFSVCDGFTTPIPRIQVDAAISGIATSIRVTAPNGGECWEIGTSQDITWEAAGVSALLKITLWKDAVSVGIIADDVDPALGTLSWTVGDYDGGTAAAGTGYTVKIKAKGAALSDTSDAAFTLSQLTVTSPNGSETWQQGSSENITWTAAHVCDDLKITLYKDAVQVGIIADNVDPALGTLAWTVGDYDGGTATPGTGYTVKLKAKGSPVADESDASFEITPPPPPELTVTAPNGGESWVQLATQNITWTSANLPGNIKITLWKDGVQVGIIADEVDPAPGSYSWAVGSYIGGTAAAGSGYTVKIKAKGAACSDTSDAAFDITAGTTPYITVTAPNGGEKWALGSSENITWHALNLPGNVKITLWKDGVQVGLIADGVDPAAGTYPWTVGDYDGGTAAAGTGYTVKIKAIGLAVSDTSDAPFEILISKDWTFMVYLDADNNLETYGISDFMEMSMVGSTADVNIVVQFDRISGYDSNYGDWTGTKRFYVTAGMTPTAANAVEDIGEANMGDPATLSSFIDWTKTNYPATNYALVLWDHGDGWRNSKKEIWKHRKDEKKDDPVFKGVCWDDSNGGDCLYMAEVKSGLNSGGGVQLIGFDACLMGMVEVAYEIRNYGQVMVGSEETEPGDGWPYDTILDGLTTNPSWTAAKFGKRIVNKYYDSYGSDWTQSAIDLTNLNTLAAAISTFAQSMIDNWDTDRDQVKTDAAAVMTQIENTVLSELHGTDWPGAHGLAIYFPETTINTNYNGTIIEFPGATQWEEFLEELHTTMSGSWIATRRSFSQEFYVTNHADLYNFCELLQLDQDDYYSESQITNAFAGGGTAQSFHADDNFLAYTLPFTFRYFGETFSAGATIYISSNGYVDFDSSSNHTDYTNSVTELAQNKRIAPCWEDLKTDGSVQTGEDVYITENVDSVVIRWVAETYGTGYPVNVELVLFDDDSVQFNYGSGNTNLYPTIGIAKGDSVNYYLSVYDSQSTLTNVDSDLYTPTPGTIRLLAPNGGETWTLGVSQNITWETTGVVGLVKITLWKGGVQQGVIATDVDSSTGTYSWVAGNHSGGTAPPGTDYTIKIKEIGNTVADTSDANFTLTDE